MKKKYLVLAILGNPLKGAVIKVYYNAPFGFVARYKFEKEHSRSFKVVSVLRCY